MMKKLFATAMLLAFVAAPLAFAQIPGPNTSYDSTQNPHAYGAPGSLNWDIVSVGGGVGTAGASDYNLEDRDGDGEVDFDGDPEYGAGGGFFPAGYWANEPLCRNGYVDHHFGEVHVHDWVFQPNTNGDHEAVSFTVGADPTPPTPVTIFHPLTGERITECVTDGCICPAIDFVGDDWFQDCVHWCDLPGPDLVNNPFRGHPGGDGGYWVFINCYVYTDGGWDGPLVSYTDNNGNGIPDDTNGDDIPDGDPQVAFVTLPSSMGGRCATMGHIYSP